MNRANLVTCCLEERTAMALQRSPGFCHLRASSCRFGARFSQFGAGKLQKRINRLPVVRFSLIVLCNLIISQHCITQNVGQL
jgi:hypothetical protein